jgi:anthranilate synthase component I
VTATDVTATDVSDPAADRRAAEALASGRPAIVWRRQIADTETPVSAALKLIEPERGDYLLESVEGGRTRGRHSMIGLAPDLVFRARGRDAEINPRWLADRDAFAPCEGDSLAALRALVGRCRMDVPDGLPKALACLVGYFAYETVGLVEDLPRPAPNPLDLPDMLFVRPSLILLFDRLTDELFWVAPVWPDAGGTVEQALERIETAQARLAGALPRRVPANAGAQGDERGAGGSGFLLSQEHDGGLAPTLPAGRYGEMVAAAKEYIAAGDIFQVVLAQRFTRPFPLPPFDLYRALRRINPSPFL